MTGIKTILAVVPDTHGGLPTLETALVAGRDLACHVHVLHVQPDPGTMLPLVGEAMAGAMINEMMAVWEKEGRARAVQVREMFDRFVERYAIPLTEDPPGPAEMSASYQECVGNEETLAATRGRLFDLIVVGRPRGDDDPALQATLNAVLLESGRPVLLAPHHPVGHLARTVTIAWNGSAESARAVAASMDVLLKADKVVVLVAEEHGILAASAEELETHLAWHGVTVDCQPLRVSPGGDVGSAILRACAQAGADLLVMGAYTHSRLRQLVLGGVTRHVIEQSPIPVLLAH